MSAEYIMPYKPKPYALFRARCFLKKVFFFNSFVYILVNFIATGGNETNTLKPHLPTNYIYKKRE